VLCNAPASCICGLHLYALYREEKYLILAFLAYAMAQVRLGLKEEYHRISLQIIRPATASDPKKGSRVPPRPNGLQSRLVGKVKWLLHMCVDEYIIRIVTIAAVLLSHAGIEAPLIFLAWWFVIFGIVSNVGDIANKYYVLIPDAGHTKKV
jgi:hypothetical protein